MQQNTHMEFTNLRFAVKCDVIHCKCNLRKNYISRDLQPAQKAQKKKKQNDFDNLEEQQKDSTKLARMMEWGVGRHPVHFHLCCCTYSTDAPGAPIQRSEIDLKNHDSANLVIPDTRTMAASSR